MVGGRAQAPRFICVTKERYLLWSQQVLYPSIETIKDHMLTPNCIPLSGVRIEKVPDV
jgi:hypothetical protein